MRKENRTLYKVLFVAMMAAMIFVATYFLSFPIYVPNKTMIKTANILCLVGGMLFGGVYGGLAAGIGSMMYDLLDPIFITSAPLTLIRFFLMGLICGLISHARGAKGENRTQNIIGATTGAVFSFLMYVTENIIKLMVTGSAFYPALVAVAPKILTSGINAAVAIVCSVLLIKPLQKALRAAGVLQRIGL